MENIHDSTIVVKLSFDFENLNNITKLHCETIFLGGHKCLLTVNGEKPKCFLCKETNHTRANCRLAKIVCTKCKKPGHGQCSYSTVTRQRLTEEEDEIDPLSENEQPILAENSNDPAVENIKPMTKLPPTLIPLMDILCDDQLVGKHLNTESHEEQPLNNTTQQTPLALPNQISQFPSNIQNFPLQNESSNQTNNFINHISDEIFNKSCPQNSLENKNSTNSDQIDSENINTQTKDLMAGLDDTSLLDIHLLLEDDSLIAQPGNQLGPRQDQLTDENISTALNKMINNGNLISENNLKTFVTSPSIEAQNLLNLKVKQVITLPSNQSLTKPGRVSLSKHEIPSFKPNPQFSTQKSQIPSNINVSSNASIQIKTNPSNIKRPDPVVAQLKQPKSK